MTMKEEIEILTKHAQELRDLNRELRAELKELEEIHLIKTAEIILTGKYEKNRS